MLYLANDEIRFEKDPFSHGRYAIAVNVNRTNVKMRCVPVYIQYIQNIGDPSEANQINTKVNNANPPINVSHVVLFSLDQ